MRTLDELGDVRVGDITVTALGAGHSPHLIELDASGARRGRIASNAEVRLAEEVAFLRRGISASSAMWLGREETSA